LLMQLSGALERAPELGLRPDHAPRPGQLIRCKLLIFIRLIPPVATDLRPHGDKGRTIAPSPQRQLSSHRARAVARGAQPLALPWLRQRSAATLGA
jgi:hypothetical protein